MKNIKTGNEEAPQSGSTIQNQNYGNLYVVSTPIGNLEDITLRAIRVLKSVDLIAVEGVQHSKRLFRHYNIKTRLTSYNQNNRRVKGPELIKKLKSGCDMALVTNAGTPGVSDPGAFLINQALKENIRISPIPGPSALTAALSVSGLQIDRFLFWGFLSSRPGRRRKELKDLISEQRTMIFFEAPHRIQAMLEDLKEILGNRRIILLRELTKLYEEIKHGTVSSVLEDLEPERLKGEFTLIVAGKKKEKTPFSLDRKTRKKIEKLLKDNSMTLKSIAAELSLKEGLSYRHVYRESLSIKRGMETSGKVS